MNIHEKRKSVYITIIILFLLLSISQLTVIAQQQTEQWDLVRCVHCEPILDVAWSPNGQLFAVATGNGIWLYGAEFEFITWLSEDETHELDWNLDGTLLASYQGKDNTTPDQAHLRIWDAREQRLVTELPTTTNHISFSWSKTENHLAYNYGDFMNIWNADTGEVQQAKNIPVEPLIDPVPGRGFIWVVRWSPDGTQVALTTGALDTLVWNVDTEQVERVFGAGLTAWDSLEWEPEGQRLALAESIGNLLYVLDMENGSSAIDLDPDPVSRQLVRKIAWSPDGSLLATDVGLGAIAIWNTLTWGLVASPPRFGQEITALAWSPDSTLLAVGNRDGSVRIWSRPGS